MGRKNKSYQRTLHQQAYDELQKRLALGDSRDADKRNGSSVTAEKIYSVNTYKTYWKQIKRFLSYVQENHPDAQTLKKAQQYVNEYLNYQSNTHTITGDIKSAWTITTIQAALNKLYHISPNDKNRYVAPIRRRVDIKRSRGTAIRDRNFNERTNEELVNFCKGCGFRRGVLERLEGQDLLTQQQIRAELSQAISRNDRDMIRACEDALQCFPDKEYFIVHRKDKGGRTRISPIIGPHISQIVTRMQTTPPGEKVWQYVNSNADIHAYRADYATALYKEYARPIADLTYKNKIKCSDGKYRSEIYICRTDERCKRLDRAAVGLVSKALGHNREDTAITNYIRNI